MMAIRNSRFVVCTDVGTICMDFEWDEVKRQSNLQKHAVDLEEMQALFDGRPILTVPSTSTVEERFLTTGVVGQRFYTVVWTKRGDVTRIISARRARDGEERAYRQVHSR